MPIPFRSAILARSRALATLNALAGLIALAALLPARAEAEPVAGPIPESIGGAAVVQIAVGNRHSCALVESGHVWCWGWNQFGQLGDGTTENRSVPVQVTGLGRVTALALGEGHSCALRTTGRVFCWGENEAGQLGNGSTADSLSPVRVVGLTGVI